MSLLDVQHIKKIYKTRFQGTQVEALKDIHFTVEKGEYVAIMGESGSGKSTLLNILAMLDQPTEGRVYLNGTDTSTIKNKDASSFRRQGQYPSPSRPLTQTRQGNDKQGGERESGVGHSPTS